MWVEPYKKKFRACERYIDPMTGKRKKVTTIIDKDTKAARKAAEDVLKEKIKEATAFKSDDDLTLGELADRFSERQLQYCRPTGARRDAVVIHSAVKIIGQDVIAKKLSARFVDQKLRESGYDATRLNSYLKIFKTMIHWAFRSEYLDDISFLERLPLYPDPGKKQRIEDKYLESDELKKLLDGMQNKKFMLLTKFLSLSGLRIGEALALNKTDVGEQYIYVTKTANIRNNTICENPKTAAGYREVYIQPELAEVIAQIRAYFREETFKNGVRTDLFFPSVSGRIMGYAAYNDNLKKESTRILQHTITPHALRHTHVSLLAEQGYPLDAISRRVGHENSKITEDIYMHVTQKRRERENEMMRNIKIL